jgi:dihydroorotate dehydrogenase (NAD+) catalytic subunit
MIRFYNGFQFDFACAAGALGFDGRGWPHEWFWRWVRLLRPKEMVVVTKTLTLLPKPGYFSEWKPWTWGCVRSLGGGSYANTIGNVNPGIEVWIKEHYPCTQKEGYQVAVSVEPCTCQEARMLGSLLYPLNICYIEVNISCPNTPTLLDQTPDILDDIIAYSAKPVVVKLSHTQAMDVEFVQRLARVPGLQAMHAINTVPWIDLFGQRPSPAEDGWGRSGGVSGPLIRDKALEAVFQIKRECDLPVIGGGGIRNLVNVHEFEDAGADAFSIGSLFMGWPWYPNCIIKQYRKISSE